MTDMTDTTEMAREMTRPTAQQVYDRLVEAYGKPRWWPGGPFTIMVSAVLVQNTAWTQVEKVLAAGDPDPAEVLAMPVEQLQEAIRPCGFMKAKAATIRRIAEWYRGYGFDIERARAAGKERLRRELLGLKGIGAETADAMLVFALRKPSFVIDAYTRRFLDRMGYGFGDDKQIRRFFESGLPADYRIYGWYHWLLLEHGKNHCRKQPLCEGCVFRAMCPGRAV
ncbi:MAG: hypothetical protein PUF51_04685 [Bifidobacteriaceae bacterium]|nr:hypothetical protein [Bifidobacteriaceae bacterium]